MDAFLQTGPELTALRSTKFYTHLRPFIQQRATGRGLAPDYLVREEDSPQLTGPDCFFFGLDFILGDLFRNVRSRRWIKTALWDMTGAEQVDEVGSHFLYRAYLNELVVLLERLQRLIALLGKGFDVPVFLAQCEEEVLQFFHPLLPQKRNANHHGLYLSYPNVQEVESLLHRQQPAEALRRFRELMGKQIEWMNYTEDAFAKFLSGFLEKVHAQLKMANGYLEPTRLPPNFSLNTRLEVNLRGKHDHEEVFRTANGDDRV